MGKDRTHSPGAGIALIALLVLAGLLVQTAFAAPRGDLGMLRAGAIENRARIAGRYSQAIEEARDARNNFLQARSEYLQGLRLGRQANFSEGELLERARGYLRTSADELIAMLDNVENEVYIVMPANLTDRPRLEELQDEWLAELDAAKENVSVIKSRIDSATTRQDFLSIGRDMRTIWREARVIGRRIYALARVEMGHVIYLRLASVESRLENMAANMSASGTDVTEVQAELEQVKALLTRVKENYQAAVAAYRADDASGGRAYLAECRRGLADATKGIRSAYNMIRRLGAGAEE